MGESMTLDPRTRQNEEFMSGANDSNQSQNSTTFEQASTPQQRYKFTPEEIRVIKECNRESFYYRCLPLGTFLGVGAFYGVKTGYLKAGAKWGAGPKMVVGSIVGYFLGKLSYQSKCAEKLMQIPNSPLADLLKRQKGKLGFQEALSMEPGFITAAPILQSAFSSNEPNQDQKGLFTDVGDTRPMNSFDTVNSNFMGYDTGKSDTTKQMLDDDNLPEKRTQQFVTTYDDLRKNNREDYEHRAQSQGGGTRRVNQPQPQSQDMSPKIKKNAYGDEWETKSQ